MVAKRGKQDIILWTLYNYKPQDLESVLYVALQTWTYELPFSPDPPAYKPFQMTDKLSMP